ncbi:MAG: formylglycine-generating enzyme family protein [Nitrospiria bacterium]
MDKLFIKVWFIFIAVLSGVGIIGLMSSFRDREDVVPLTKLGAAESPKENPMVFIPAGEFVMGSEDGGFNEKPRRTVYLDAYEINQLEVSQFHYAEFVKATNHRSPLSRYVKNIELLNHPNQPAVYVSWEDAYDYCRWRGARLPTEAEWEKAARGVQGLVWPWEGEFKPALANFSGDEDEGVYTTIVGSYEKDKSPYGLYDMAGNVREWVQDWYEEQYYQHAPARNPKGPDHGEMKTLRGSSWNDSHFSGRTTSRLKMFPFYRDTTVGFRCARTIRQVTGNQRRSSQ